MSKRNGFTPSARHPWLTTGPLQPHARRRDARARVYQAPFLTTLRPRRSWRARLGTWLIWLGKRLLASEVRVAVVAKEALRQAQEQGPAGDVHEDRTP